MNNSKYIQTLLNESIQALHTILPLDINIKSPSITSEPFVGEELGVLIGLTGDIKGRLIIDSAPSTFGAIGEKMFGMPLEGEMLESFTGEFGNMFAGNFATQLGQNSLAIDITTPTIFVGNTKIYGFEKAFRLPAYIEDVGDITILFAIDAE